MPTVTRSAIEYQLRAGDGGAARDGIEEVVAAGLKQAGHAVSFDHGWGGRRR